MDKFQNFSNDCLLNVNKSVEKMGENEASDIIENRHYLMKLYTILGISKFCQGQYQSSLENFSKIDLQYLYSDRYLSSFKKFQQNDQKGEILSTNFQKLDKLFENFITPNSIAIFTALS